MISALCVEVGGRGFLLCELIDKTFCRLPEMASTANDYSLLF